MSEERANEQQVDQLLDEVETIYESYEKVSAATGEKFNVFSILNMESNEVGTHSRFLAELLNPHGSHCQQDLFLKEFIALLHRKEDNIEGKEAFEFDTGSASVFIEYYIGNIDANYESGGRIDILIRDRSGNIIMIENKIWAQEQENQLIRYKNKFPDGKLIYLTLYGERSWDTTFDKDNYLCLSYRDDIIEWLEICHKESVNIPILRESITQYINLIKKLTNQNINSEMEQKITSRILKNEQSFEAFSALAKISPHEILESIYDKGILLVLQELKKDDKLKDFKLEIDKDKDKKFLSGKEYVGFKYLHPKLTENNLCIEFQFDRPGHKDLCFGLTFEKPEVDNSNYEKIRKGFNDKFANSESNDLWLCYKYVHELDDWKQLSNWEDMGTLKKIFFKDDLEIALKKTLGKIAEIINTI